MSAMIETTWLGCPGTLTDTDGCFGVLGPVGSAGASGPDAAGPRPRCRADAATTDAGAAAAAVDAATGSARGGDQQADGEAEPDAASSAAGRASPAPDRELAQRLDGLPPGPRVEHGAGAPGALAGRQRSGRRREAGDARARSRASGSAGAARLEDAGLELGEEGDAVRGDADDERAVGDLDDGDGRLAGQSRAFHDLQAGAAAARTPARRANRAASTARATTTTSEATTRARTARSSAAFTSRPPVGGRRGGRSHRASRVTISVMRRPNASSTTTTSPRASSVPLTSRSAGDPGEPVELDDVAGGQREQLAHRHAGAAEFAGDLHLDVPEHVDAPAARRARGAGRAGAARGLRGRCGGDERHPDERRAPRRRRRAGRARWCRR